MMYLAHFAWSLELTVTAAGFVALYFAFRERSAPLQIGAWVLIIGGALGLGCNIYYSVLYWQQGAFNSLVIPGLK